MSALSRKCEHDDKPNDITSQQLFDCTTRAVKEQLVQPRCDCDQLVISIARDVWRAELINQICW